MAVTPPTPRRVHQAAAAHDREGGSPERSTYCRASGSSDDDEQDRHPPDERGQPGHGQHVALPGRYVTTHVSPHSAQQDSFSGSLNREMALIFRASAIVGQMCKRSMKSWSLARNRSAIAASSITSDAPFPTIVAIVTPSTSLVLASAI